MAVPAARPCEPWVRSITASDDERIVARSVQMATEFLWALSGRRFGYCSVTTRPCRRACVTEDAGLRTWPTRTWGWWAMPDVPTTWMFEPVCGLHRTCGCAQLEEIRLPSRPVVEVTEVLVDGVVLDPDAYRVDEYRWLVRTDGDLWPACQDLSLPVTEAPTFQVAWRYGRPVPELGRFAAEKLADQFALSMVGDPECALPDNVVEVVRQGITIEVDPAQLLSGGSTNVREVQMFLAAYNPNRLQSRARVFRADATPGGRRTGT